MRIVSLEPFITDTLISLELEGRLVGVSHACHLPSLENPLQHESNALVNPSLSILKAAYDKMPQIPKITCSKEIPLASEWSQASPLSNKLGRFAVDIAALKSLAPDVVLARSVSIDYRTDQDQQEADREISGKLSQALGKDVKYFCFNPLKLEDLFKVYERLGKFATHKLSSMSVAARSKAQIMNWSDNFYERMKNKHVVFISSIEPLQLAGLWIPDLIQLASSIPMNRASAKSAVDTTWEEIIKFRPDVILVAPDNSSLHEALKSFKTLQQVPVWDEILAVKRGDVFFTDGAYHFNRPGPLCLMESMSILISALAGIDSGYISPRDSFYRLRTLEMQRHKL